MTNALLSSSPSAGLNAMVNMSLSQTTLAPGEIVKNSGKFSKPTKIPGKNYSKDEIIIRNSDSGKGELSVKINFKRYLKYHISYKILNQKYLPHKKSDGN